MCIATMPSISDIALFLKEHSTELTLAITIAGAAYAAIRVIFGRIAQFLSWLRRVVASLRNVWRLANGVPTIPSETVRIIPDEHRAYWHTEAWVDGPRTILSSTWDVLNILDRPVALPAVYIRSPREARGQGYLQRSQTLSLSPNTLTRIDAKFIVCPAIHTEGKPIKATVIFLDQYKNEYPFNTVFKPPAS